MKKLILMATVLVSGIAQAAPGQPGSTSLSIIPKAETPVKVNGVYVKATPEAKEDVTLKGLPNASVRKTRKAEGQHRLGLDSIVNRTEAGDYISKEAYEYDENGNSRFANFYNWDSENSTWSLSRNIILKWDDHNRCTFNEECYYSMWGDSGQRKEMTYDENGFNIETISYNLTQGEWQPTQKGMYKYNEAGSPIEEIIQVPGTEAGSWVNYQKTTVDYSQDGLWSETKSYAWQNEEWTPSGALVIWEYDSKGQLILFVNDVWDPEKSAYVHIQRTIQEWNEYGLTYQTLEYWNEENQDWNGSTYQPSMCARLSYDTEGRKSEELGYAYDFEKKEYVEMNKEVLTYTALENDVTHSVSLFYNTKSEPVLLVEKIRDYNRANKDTYLKTSARNDGESPLLPYEEKIYAYTDNGINMTLGEEYTFEGETRYASFKQEHVYDSEGYPEESWYQFGNYMMTGEGDSEAWMNYTHFLYEYEHGEETSRMAYQWNRDEEDYVPFWGDTTEFDFTVPISDCLYWINADLGGVKYQITSRRRYNPDGTGWRYNEGKWYYSELNQSGVKDVTDSDFRVYPNPAETFVKVEGAAERQEINIYSLTGERMISTTGEYVDVSGLSKGLYILTAGNKSVKLIKK